MSIVVPRSIVRNFVNPFPFGAGPNPVETGPKTTQGTRGNFKVILEDNTTGFKCEFRISGGYSSQTLNPRRNFYLKTGTEVLCTVSNPILNTFDITTDASDSGGRTYRLAFAGYVQTPPTIEKTGGAALTGDFTITYEDCFIDNFN